MQFSIPQFIEKEAKIAGPLTFRQLLYLAGAGGIIILLYYSLAKTNPFLFTIITIILIGLALAFAFFRVGGYSFTAFLKYFISFIMSSKIYLWEKKITPIKILQKREATRKETLGKPTLKIAGGSKLKQLSTQIETR